jgi:hypothetical protein
VNRGDVAAALAAMNELITPTNSGDGLVGGGRLLLNRSGSILGDAALIRVIA